MNETTDKNRIKKYNKAAGAACFPIAAVCISVVVITIIDFVNFIILPELDDSSILYFIGGAFRFGLYIVYPLCIIIAVVLSVGFIRSGIALIKQSDTPKTKNAIILSFIGSLAICLLSIYPFVISTCRIIAHGYQEQYYLGFWLGMFAFIFSTLYLVLNRIAVKIYKSILKQEHD